MQTSPLLIATESSSMQIGQLLIIYRYTDLLSGNVRVYDFRLVGKTGDDHSFDSMIADGESYCSNSYRICTSFLYGVFRWNGAALSPSM